MLEIILRQTYQRCVIPTAQRHEGTAATTWMKQDAKTESRHRQTRTIHTRGYTGGNNQGQAQVKVMRQKRWENNNRKLICRNTMEHETFKIKLAMLRQQTRTYGH